MSSKDIEAYGRSTLQGKPKRQEAVKARRSRAASVLLDIDLSISVDLVAFEDARPGLQEVVLKEGREL